jgi:pyruvate/2-oxoacid:ferredoxin oxidoreductase alpha subunit
MAGRPVGPGELRELGIQKRWRKFELVRQELEAPPWILGLTPAPQLEDYDAVVLGFGSTAGAIAEGVRLAAQEGIRALAVHPLALHPLPLRHLTRLSARFDAGAILVFDQNPGGDLARHLQAELGLRARSFRRLDGEALRPLDVLTRLREASARTL